VTTQLARRYVDTQGNRCIWGHLFVNTNDREIAAWRLNSWSFNGPPYWIPKMYWLDKSTNKLYHDHGLRLSPVQDIESDREAFMRESAARWEVDWLNEEQVSNEADLRYARAVAPLLVLLASKQDGATPVSDVFWNEVVSLSEWAKYYSGKSDLEILKQDDARSWSTVERVAQAIVDALK
jgi:hypothetical protein